MRKYIEDLIQAIVMMLFGVIIIIVNACDNPSAVIIILGALLICFGVLALIFYFINKSKFKARRIVHTKALAEFKKADIENMKAVKDEKNTNVAPAAKKEKDNTISSLEVTAPNKKASTSSNTSTKAKKTTASATKQPKESKPEAAVAADPVKEEC